MYRVHDAQRHAFPPPLDEEDATRLGAIKFYLTEVVRQPLTEINMPFHVEDYKQREQRKQELSKLYDAILMTGVSADGQTLGIHVTGFLRHFFIQFHDPAATANDAVIEQYLLSLQRECLLHKSFKVPEAGNLSARDTVYNGKITDHGIVKWRRANGLHKTVYGWTPSEMNNIIQVWVKHPMYCAAYTRFVDSDEYLVRAKLPLVRTFEGSTMPDDLQFRLDRGLRVASWCYIVPPFSRLSDDIFYAQKQFSVHMNQVHAMHPNTAKTMMPPQLRTLFFDIECANRIVKDAYDGTEDSPFPIAEHTTTDMNKRVDFQVQRYKAALKKEEIPASLGALFTIFNEELAAFQSSLDSEHPPTVTQYLETKPTLDPLVKCMFRIGDTDKGLLCNANADQFLLVLESAAKDIKASLQEFRKHARPWDSLLPWYTGTCSVYGALAPYLVVPNPMETEPVIVVVGVLRYSNKPATAPYAKAVALVYQHPNQEAPIDRTLLTQKSAQLARDYEHIELRIFNSEVALLKGVETMVHEMQPNFMSGWNSDHFDLVYMVRRHSWHKIYGGLREFGNLNFGLLRHISGKLVDPTSFSSRAAAQEEFPFLDNLDEEGGGGEGLDDDESPKAAATVQGNENGRLSGAMMARVGSPLIVPMDAIVVWKNASFGAGKRKSYKLDDVAADELVYEEFKTEDKKSLPRRKLQISHHKTTETWRKGGKDLWFFIVYCYVDTVLPLLLLEKRAKLPLLLSMGSVCNCSLNMIYNNGMQSILMPLFYTKSREYYKGLYLVPEWGRRLLHWPDVWLSSTPLVEARNHPFATPKPKNAKGYMGAIVMDPTRGLHDCNINTADFASLYPSLMKTNHYDFTTLLTSKSKQAYGVPNHHVHEIALGPANIIFCGEIKREEEIAQMDGYNTPMVKTAQWNITGDEFQGAIIKEIMADRSYWKKEMAKWAYYTIMLKYHGQLPPSSSEAETSAQWNPSTVALDGYKEKIGGFHYDRMFKAAKSLEAWNAELAVIEAETPGRDREAKIFCAAANQTNADSSQLADKLVINSDYGFNGAGIKGAKMPAMEVAAATTAAGRRTLCLTRNVNESLSVSYVKEQLTTPTAMPLLKTPALLSSALKEEEGALTFEFDDLPAQNATDEELAQAYEHYRRLDRFDVHYGDTDSVMVGHCREYNEEGMKLSIRMAGFSTSLVNSLLYGIMNVVPEKTSKRTLFIDRKNYIMWLTSQKDLLYKGVEVVRGDTIPFVNRVITMAANRILHTEEYNLASVVDWVKKELMDFARGKVEVAELVLHRKLSKMHYINAPEHVKVAEKMRSRGEKVEVGDMIEYVYVLLPMDVDKEKKRLKTFDQAKGKRLTLPDLKVTGGEVAEHVAYALNHNVPINYARYWTSTVKNAVCKFFRHILDPQLYPRVDETMSNDDQLVANAERARIKVEQNARVEKIMCAEVDAYFAKQEKLRNQLATNTQTLFSVIAKTKEITCIQCANFFNVNRSDNVTKICNNCLLQKEDLAHSIIARVKDIGRQQEAAVATCKMCVAATGFSEFDIEACTKFDCPIYETRRRLVVEKMQANKRLESLRLDNSGGPSVEEPVGKRPRLSPAL